MTEKPTLEIIDKNGNAFNLLAKARRVAKANNMPWQEIKEEATSGDYDHLLATLDEHFDIQ